MSQLNAPLEAFSGTWTILAAYCVVFILLHLFATGRRQHLSWHRWLFQLPVGMQIAVATMVACFAEFITRFTIWYWRFTTDGDPGQLLNFAAPLATGAIVGICGFLCILRVVTKPFGSWPLIMAVLTVLGYLVTFL